MGERKRQSERHRVRVVCMSVYVCLNITAQAGRAQPPELTLSVWCAERGVVDPPTTHRHTVSTPQTPTLSLNPLHPLTLSGMSFASPSTASQGCSSASAADGRSTGLRCKGGGGEGGWARGDAQEEDKGCGGQASQHRKRSMELQTILSLSTHCVMQLGLNIHSPSTHIRCLLNRVWPQLWAAPHTTTHTTLLTPSHSYLQQPLQKVPG